MPIRLDIGFSMCILTQHLDDPRPTHFAMAQRYCFTFWGRKSWVWFLGEIMPTLISFTDASFVNDPVDRRSMGDMLYVRGIVSSPGL